MAQFLTSIRNKVFATLIRQGAGCGFGARAIPTQHDEILQIPSRDEGIPIKVHVYKSKNPTTPSPVLINFHGSGFVIPMHGSDDDFCLHVAKSTPYTVLDVQYRLAPENMFPAGAQDAEDVVRYVLSRPQEFDVKNVSVSGFSAGANFALGLAGAVFPRDIFRHVVAFYPPVNLAKDPGTKVAPDPSGRPIPAYIAGVFNDCYLPVGVARDQPLVSPSFIEAERWPDSMLVITCAQDNLAPEAEELVEKIKGVGGSGVRHERMEGVGHAWDKEAKAGTVQEERKRRAYALAAEILTK
ncbi:esterase/lipase [Setomelanomma holmii]|uniref:Esterase/lipase n=1 Tax=Setomelanomma holmii TaxID=210430 RepID=A0A9P4LTC8_9PLEO|nr:esterase/lipase [Setomelanomma holmii]